MDGRFLDLVDGVLEGIGIVGQAVGVNGKFVGSEVDRSGVVQAFRVGGIGARQCTHNQKTGKGKKRLQHELITKWLARGFSL
jgi:hypothetical protein